jgi:hypothetical protein
MRRDPIEKNNISIILDEKLLMNIMKLGIHL